MERGRNGGDAMTRRQRVLRAMPDSMIEDIVDQRYWRTWWSDACIELCRRIDDAVSREADPIVGPWRVAPPEGMV